MEMDKHKQLLKQEAYRIGFDYIGVSRAEFLAEEAPRLEAWLRKDFHGKMQYMENHFDKRLDPTLLVEGAKTVITLLYNYHNPQPQTDGNAPHISTYAYGKDYHHVIKEKLRELMVWINHHIGNVNGRAFVDSAPVLERAWAAKSGTGWIGKNSMLITKQNGSFFFLAELITDLDLPPDPPIRDYCGRCTRCIDACPTQALIGNKQIDASRCISYFTIELRDELLPSDMTNKFENWMFGCDICQNVCPWNRFALKHREPAFEPNPEMLNMSRQEWSELTEETFHQIFKQSAVKRTKYTGLMRNIAFLNQKK